MLKILRPILQRSYCQFAILPLTALVIQDHRGISKAAPADAPLRSLSISKGEDSSEMQATDNVNTLAAEKLYSLAGDWAELGPDTLLFDVCCGTGTIGLTLAHHVGIRGQTVPQEGPSRGPASSDQLQSSAQESTTRPTPSSHATSKM
ncbi:hypothetical protein L3X38_044731 [Prunus dulcis]|uniref:S-adenosyl-L-methionine-dependent methyltransferases superfamily protein n=1 Tax=Prunus dulcis TaxID=3755 RepID=A0AAD4UZ05_PRUDU|nr:hypothetical protein L3X38_044731 [Prunus dulcis]